MKRFSLVLIMMLLFIFATACGNDDASGDTKKLDPTNFSVEFAGAQEVVPTGEFTKYTVTVKDSNGKTTSVDKVYLFMNMEGMHHPTEGTMKEVQTGVYELELPLAMEGEWYAEVTITVGDKEHTYGKYYQKAEGKKHMMYMKGYNADLGKPNE